jgi:hypothetical protein
MTKAQYRRFLIRHKIIKKARESEKEYPKLKRRIVYEIYYYDPENNGILTERDFDSVNKARSFVNILLEKYKNQRIDLEIVKVWCYRKHHPRHKTYYVCYIDEPNRWIKYDGY